MSMPRTPPRRIVLLAVAVLIVLLGLATAVAVPMRRGASLREAIAVFPQRVLWGVPIALLLPGIVALAHPLRPRSVRAPSPDVQRGESGGLAAVAETLRRATGGRISRARVIARLVRLATAMAVARHGVDDASAWQIVLDEMQQIAPSSARFLQGDGLDGWTAEQFTAGVRQILSTLEQNAREA